MYLVIQRLFVRCGLKLWKVNKTELPTTCWARRLSKQTTYFSQTRLNTTLNVFASLIVLVIFFVPPTPAWITSPLHLFLSCCTIDMTTCTTLLPHTHKSAAQIQKCLLNFRVLAATGFPAAPLTPVPVWPLFCPLSWHRWPRP